MNRSVWGLVGAVAAQLLGVPAVQPGPVDAGTHMESKPPGADFRLSIRQRPGEPALVVPLATDHGAIPIWADYWKCGWRLQPNAEAPTTLIVECQPLNREQGAVTSVSCSRTEASHDLALLTITTRQQSDDPKPASQTGIEISCTRM